MRQHAQPNSSTTENLTSSLSDIPLSMRPFSGIETSSTVRAQPRITHLYRDQESVSFLSANNTADLPDHTLKESSRPPTLDPYPYSLRLDNQI